MPAPDFIGVGAQRSGTTWWFRSLLTHPQIRSASGRTKETHFFDRFGAWELRAEDIAGYHELFRRKRGQVAGEWTPRYMSDVWTPRLLCRAAPEAKILVLLRDPVERYRSGLVHRLTRAPERRREMLAADAIERGRYASQLERLRRCFAPERMLVLQYERCREEPAEQYRRTLRFLGVEEDHTVDFERPRGTTTEAKKDPMWPELRDALRTTLRPEVAALAALVPDLDLSLWPNFADLAPADAPAA